MEDRCGRQQIIMITLSCALVDRSQDDEGLVVCVKVSGALLRQSRRHMNDSTCK